MQDIKKNKFYDEKLSRDMNDRWDRAASTMRLRTAGFSLFSRISHNQSIYETKKNNVYSEGSTQALKRKIRAQTIQRIPDGEISTQFDKNSIEHVETEFIFKNKVLRSEYQGANMLKNIWRTFNAAYDYGFGCVRTGFEKDTDGDIRTSYKIIGWNDIYPAPDCQTIEDAEWYIVREYMSKSELEALLDKGDEECWDDALLTDMTYEEDVVKYLVCGGIKDGVEPMSAPLADQKKGALKTESVEIRTLYVRGESEFITFVPSLGAKLRTVKNYDPRKDVPLHFMILDPDPEFPLGVSTILYTIQQQQFADAFQSQSYDTLMLAGKPPVIGYGGVTPSMIKMTPGAFWPMGTNPNAKVEKFPIETTTLTSYNSILEGVQSRMMASLNIADGTIAADMNTRGYSKTGPGVEAQQRDKTVTVNQYQKMVEVFFSDWANHAIRSYINAMGGKHWMTVDEETRRRIWDIEMHEMDPASGGDPDADSIIDGDKIEIDFDMLSTDLLSFSVKTGSLIESEKETERKNIQEALVPISQMLGAVSDQNKSSFEEILMKMITRFLEMSDIDISQQTADVISDNLAMQAIQATMEQVMQQQQQIAQLQQQAAPQPQMQQGMPQEGAIAEQPIEGQEVIEE